MNDRPNPEDSVLAIAYVRRSGESYMLRNIPPGRYWLMLGINAPHSYRSQVVFCKEVELEADRELSLDLSVPERPSAKLEPPLKGDAGE
ncbi:MAG: hypothetical protein PHR35_19095 [Kiritimatiellae bacterium]|nr:hypothetical protein [Kiritimatiellia bacterium]